MPKPCKGMGNLKSDTLLFKFWSQTRKPRIPDEEFQSDNPWSPKLRKFKKRREISNVGWSQELTEVLTATHAARLQFDSCAEKHSLCGTVMIHDGLNLRCLDQCHGVRSHGTSSSQGWRKKYCKVLYSLQWQSKFDPWVYILVFAEAIKAIAQMNTDWQVENAQHAEFIVPTCEHPLKPPMFDSLYRRSWDAKTL